MGISPRRITVSTVGLVPMMERLLTEFPCTSRSRCMRRPTICATASRRSIKRYPLEALIEACGTLPLKRRGRITFEYVMLRGVNDSPEHAQRLAKLLAPLRAKVNLIFFNAFDGFGLHDQRARTRSRTFKRSCGKGNLTATIRESRGADIAAACGQLYAEQARRARADGGGIADQIIR